MSKPFNKIAPPVSMEIQIDLKHRSLCDKDGLPDMDAVARVLGLVAEALAVAGYTTDDGAMMGGDIGSGDNRVAYWVIHTKKETEA